MRTEPSVIQNGSSCQVEVAHVCLTLKVWMAYPGRVLPPALGGKTARIADTRGGVGALKR